MSDATYRLVTRADFDGLVCAALLRHLEMIDEVKFAHPKDVQDGKVAVTGRDIITNLPYVPEAHLVFDHHASETVRVSGNPQNHVIDPEAPSAARVVFDHFGGFERFPFTWEQMMDEVDKADSAAFSRDDILYPEGWTLLSFLMDARTGFGRFHEFTISNHQLMIDLVDYCRFRNIDEIFEIPDVVERVRLYRKQQGNFKAQIERCTTMRGDVAVLDLRNEVTVFPGNRFMIYALFPEAKISMHVIWGRNHENTVFAVGKSILNRTSTVNVGALMLRYGGGGHAGAGTCQIANGEAERVREELLGALNSRENEEVFAAASA